MADSKVGTVAWVDLTVEDAPRLRDFYEAVIGWKPSPVNMRGYDDFNMNVPGTSQAVAGVCHARGGNATLPPQWLIYVPVQDLAASLAACERLGGKVMQQFKSYTLIEDPAGAVMMIYQAE